MQLFRNTSTYVVIDWKLIKIVLCCAVGGMFLLFVFYARFNVMNDFANESGTLLIKFNGISYPASLINLIKLRNLRFMLDVTSSKLYMTNTTALPFRLRNEDGNSCNIFHLSLSFYFFFTFSRSVRAVKINWVCKK